MFENDSLLGLDCIFVDETVTPLTHILHKPSFEVLFLIFHFCSTPFRILSTQGHHRLLLW